MFGREALEIVRAAGFRAGAREAVPAEGLYADHRPDHVAVDVEIARMRQLAHELRRVVDARMQTHGQAVARRVDLGHQARQAARLVAHHMQDRPEDLLIEIGGAVEPDDRRRHEGAGCRRCRNTPPGLARRCAT